MRKGGLFLALGDSITWTAASKGEDLYASRVWKSINTSYSPIRHINKGIGGTNSSRLLSNMRWAAIMKPDLVTIGVGMNDCQSNTVPLTTYNSNLSEVIDFLKVQNPDVHIILCTPSRTNEATRAPNVQAYRDEMASVSIAKNVSLCRFENAFTEGEIATLTVDGIHPNSAGHQKLFSVLWPVVQTGAWLNKI